MRVFVIGPMDKGERRNAKEFDEASDHIRRHGNTPFIPQMFVPECATGEFSIRRQVETLMLCDQECLLPDWRDSKDAVILRNLAIDVGIPVVNLARYAI